jgi:hypothetical protein
MSNRISLDREEVDRMILLGMDVHRYQTQVVPDLQQRVFDLTRAPKDLVGAVGAARKNAALEGLVDGACVRAQNVLDAGLPPSKGAEAVNLKPLGDRVVLEPIDRQVDMKTVRVARPSGVQIPPPPPPH